MAVKTVKQRFIYGFGGSDIDDNCANFERYMRLDVQKVNKGWETLYLKNQFSADQQSVVPLGFNSENFFQFLICGGSSQSGLLDQSAIFSTNITDFQMSSFALLDEFEMISDQFFDN
jgi:hypothetical protein